MTMCHIFFAEPTKAVQATALGGSASGVWRFVQRRMTVRRAACGGSCYLKVIIDAG